MAQELTGCPVPAYTWSELASCCDAHHSCYAACGVSQPFCDTQLQLCLSAKADLPECQVRVDTFSNMDDLVLHFPCSN